MTVPEFVAEYSILERKLCSMLPGFKIRDGMTLLLNNLLRKNKISEEACRTMREIAEFRNRLVGNHPKTTFVTPEATNKIEDAKRTLGL